jgi:hypothetical protein
MLIDVAIPSNKNITQEEAVKKLKYKNLSTELQRMWNIKCFVILVVTEATGIVTKGLKISGSNTRKAFNRFFTQDSCTGNNAYNKESTTILKSEW